MQGLYVLVATALFVSVSLFAKEGPQEKESYVNFTDVYVQRSRGIVEPHELLVQGMFPNGCHKWAKSEVEHLDDFTHQVRGISRVTQGMCIMVMVPFTKEVDLGVLKPGRHKVEVINGDGTTFEKEFVLQ